jgi:hypothetical protein
MGEAYYHEDDELDRTMWEIRAHSEPSLLQIRSPVLAVPKDYSGGEGRLGAIDAFSRLKRTASHSSAGAGGGLLEVQK